MSIHVAVKGAERTIPSWEHLQAQRPNHKSFEESKSPSIRPWIQAWALTWMIHWWGFLATAMKVLLSEQVGTHADHTLIFYFHEAMGQTESIYSNIYSALLESEQRHYCIARGFLKWPGPRMGLSPANPLCFPRVWGAMVTGLWMSCHQWGPILTQTMISYWEGGRQRDFRKQENKSIASKLYIALIPQLVCNSEGLQTVRLLCNNPWDQIHIELKDFEER